MHSRLSVLRSSGDPDGSEGFLFVNQTVTPDWKSSDICRPLSPRQCFAAAELCLIQIRHIRFELCSLEITQPNKALLCPPVHPFKYPGKTF